MAQRKVYYIPDNFVDDEKIFGGKFRKRNFIEAVIFTLPVLGLFWLINWATGIGWGTLFYPTFLESPHSFFSLSDITVIHGAKLCSLHKNSVLTNSTFPPITRASKLS